MSTCRGCGAPIDWITTTAGKYMPVDPEPVFIVEGDFSETFITDTGDVINGEIFAGDDEDKSFCEVAFVPHWKTCPNAGQFRRRR